MIKDIELFCSLLQHKQALPMVA